MTTQDQHNRSRYQAGCRCAKCCESNRLYARNHRRAKQGRLYAVAAPKSSTTPETSTETPGPVAAAVTAQLESNPAALERPGVAAIALALARVLDNDAAIPQHPSAAHRLTEILAVLSKTAHRRGRLRAVRTMTAADDKDDR